MTYEWQIKSGDEVKVFYTDSDDFYYTGTVRYMPQATGDSWIIEGVAGFVTYQQTFNRIVRIRRGE